MYVNGIKFISLLQTVGLFYTRKTDIQITFYGDPQMAMRFCSFYTIKKILTKTNNQH